jgi:hypothetical protein
MRRIWPLYIVLALALARPDPAAAAGPQAVRLRILDHGRPAVQVEVRVTYPREGSTIGTTMTLITDRRGFVTFSLPADVFWVTVPQLNSQVVGRRFTVPARASAVVRWDLRPRDWQPGREERP